MIPKVEQANTGEIKPESIPEKLKRIDQWTNWAEIWSEDKEKFSKPPMKASGRNGSSTDETTWTTLKQSLAALGREGTYVDNSGKRHRVTLDGVGLAGLGRTPFSGIDLDHCIDPETGEINPAAQKIVENFNSYTEITPSGDGLRIWIEAEKPPTWSANKTGETEIEVYGKGRFFTVTGHHLEGTPRTIEARQEALDTFMVEYAPADKPKPKREPYTGSGDYVLDLDRFLEEFGVVVLKQYRDATSERAYNIVCPWAHEHTGGDKSGTRAGQYQSGALWFHCDHGHCDGRKWEHFREELDPEAYRRAEITVGGRKRTPDSNDSNDSVFQDLVDLPDPADFPTEALPPSTRRFVREAAASIGCPVDYLATSVLAALSTAIGDTRRIVLKKDWSEGAAIFAAIVGGPASKKTPAMNAALLPVRERQLVLKREYERQKDEYKSKLREYEKLGKNGPVEYAPPKKPTLGRTYADDTTVERFADTLNENSRGVLVAKDELSGWLGGMNQYKQGGKGADRQFWLSVHTNQSIVVDRKSLEEPVIVPRPFASVIGGIQPDVLPDFGKDRGDGLLDRFVFSYPAPKLGEWSDDEISDEARSEYTETIKQLYRLEHAEDAEGAPFPSRVRMSGAAKEMFVVEYNRLHKELEDPGFPQRLRPAWGKLEAYLARFSLILAMTRIAEPARASGYEEIVEEDMSGAIKLLAYYKHQARRVYTGLYGDSPSDRLAADLRDFLLRRSGTWEGIASELHAALDSEHKPERPEDLSKAVRSIAKRSSLLRWEDLKRTQERRPFRLTLENAVIAVIADMPSSLSENGDEDRQAVKCIHGKVDCWLCKKFGGAA